MSEQEQYEKFRADLYAKAMAELKPIIETATEQAVTSHLAAKSALEALSYVARQIQRLDIITSDDDEVPARLLRETLTVDDLIRKAESESFVYFIEAGDFIKIGYSRDPIGRLSQIRKGSNVTIPEGVSTEKARILAFEQGGQSHEKELHKRFADFRVAGEWFEKHDRLIHYIKSIEMSDATTQNGRVA